MLRLIIISPSFLNFQLTVASTPLFLHILKSYFEKSLHPSLGPKYREVCISSVDFEGAVHARKLKPVHDLGSSKKTCPETSDFGFKGLSLLRLSCEAGALCCDTFLASKLYSQ